MSALTDPALTCLAFCWRIDRGDGVALGFTSHDRDLRVGGIVYRAAPGMLPSAISLSDGFEVDTLDIADALSDAAIGADDLAAGRWDGARVRLFATGWDAPGDETIALIEGRLGDVATGDGGFTAELRGAAALLERPAVEQTSPECRAALGDRRCRVDLAPRTRIATVAECAGPVVTLTDAMVGAGAGAAHDYGRVRWIDGANAGLAGAVLTGAGASLTLREPPAFAVAPGTRIELREGCDKRFETCRDRFANTANFRGEPHLPGNDLLLSYPSA